MSRPETSRLPLLLGIGTALAGLLYLDRVILREADDVAQPGPLASRPAGIVRRTPMPTHPLSQLRLADLAEILERPLFEPSRRLPRRAPSEAAAPAARLPIEEQAVRHHLLGVVSSPERTIAVMTTSEARLVRVEVDDEVDGWKLTRITPTEVTLSRGRESKRMTLFQR